MVPNFTILYVDSPAASAAVYGRLFGREPVEASPGFVMYAFESGDRLGLWARHDVQPAVTAPPGGSELCFAVADAQALQAIYEEWRGQGLAILQEPVEMEFGRTFVAADPDGHRLRVFVRPA